MLLAEKIEPSHIESFEARPTNILPALQPHWLVDPGIERVEAV